MGATGLKSPEEERTQERLNPGARRQQDREEGFGQPDRERTNLSGKEKDDFDDIARNNGDLDDLKNAENDPGAPAKSGNTGDPAASEDSPWRTNLQADSSGGGKKPGTIDQYKKYKKWGLIGGAIGTVVFGGFSAFFGLMNFAVINFKEVNYESTMKRSYTKSAQRAAKTKAKQWFNNPEECSGVRCRYKSGVDQRQLDKFRRLGIEADVTPTDVPKPGSFKLNTLTLPDGTVLNGGNFAEEFKRNPQVRSMLASAAETKGSFTRTKAMLRKMSALNMSRKNFLADANSEEERDKALRQRTAGVDGNGIDLNANASDPDNPNAAGTDNASVDGLSEDIREAADETRRNFIEDPDFEPDEASAVEAGRIASSGLQNSLKYGGRLDGVVQGACTAYTIIKAVDIGAKVLLAAQLMRYAQTLMAFADSIKAGEATAQDVSLVANLLFSTNEKGQNFFDSPGYQYISYGTPPNQTEIAPFLVGASFAAVVAKARNTIDRVSGGNASSVCRVVQSLAFQGAAIVLTGVAAFFSVGTSAAATLAAGAATSAVLGVLEAYAVPLLINMAAGASVDPDNGYELGSAVAAGMSAFSSELSRAQGLRPMKEGEVAANQAEMNRLYNDFFPDDKPTLTDKVLTNMAMFSMQSFSSISSLMQPQQLFANAGANHSIASVYATDAIAPGSACKDPDYEGLATTDFCTLIYSELSSTLESPQFDPEVTQKFMLDNGHINDAGDPLSDEYKDYVAICMDGTVPLVDTGVDGADAAGDSVRDYCADPSAKKTHFRLFRMDSNLTEDPDAVAALYNTGGAAGEPAAGTGQLADCGTAQQCAQKILETANITYDPGIRAQVEQIAATGAISGIAMSPTILQVLLAAAAEGIPLRLSSSVRPGDPGHHGQGRAFDVGNEEVADRLMPFIYNNRVQFKIDELIYSNPPAGTANLNGGVDHQYNSGTIQQHANHVHISVSQ